VMREGGYRRHGWRGAGGGAVVGLLLAVVVACAVNPVTGQHQLSLLNESQEIALGAQEHPGILDQYGALEAPSLERYVDQVGQRLVRVSHRPHLTYRFTVLDSPILNAFALPGGYIYVTRGLLAELNNEAELAGVVGHEIGHVTARHGAQRYTQAAGYQFLKGLAVALQPGLANWTQLSDLAFSAAVSGYGRANEFQADQLGLEYAAAAGYDTGQLHHFFETLLREERDAGQGGFHGLFASHPETRQRIERLRARAAEVPGGKRVERPAYLKAIAGIPVGPSEYEGRVVAGDYLNPGFDVAVQVPSGWQVQTARGRLALRAPDGELSWQASLRAAQSGESNDAVMAAMLRQIGAQAEPRPLAQPSGALQVELPVTADGAPLALQVTTWVSRDTAVTVLAFGEPETFARNTHSLAAITASLTPLTADQRRQAAPERLQLHTVRTADDFASLARRYPGDARDAAWLSYFNGYDGRPSPRPGDLVKVVTPEND
jgi:predicted Zn-dependent protease